MLIGLEGFNRDIARWQADFIREVDECIRSIGAELLRGMTKKTPVGTTGRARASWRVGVGRPNTTKAARGRRRSPSQAEHEALEKGLDRLKTPGAGLHPGGLFITNSLNYVFALEGGSSPQAPAGMVRLTVAELEAALKITKPEKP